MTLVEEIAAAAYEFVNKSPWAQATPLVRNDYLNFGDRIMVMMKKAQLTDPGQSRYLTVAFAVHAEDKELQLMELILHAIAWAGLGDQASGRVLSFLLNRAYDSDLSAGACIR